MLYDLYKKLLEIGSLMRENIILVSYISISHIPNIHFSKRTYLEEWLRKSIIFSILIDENALDHFNT